MLPLLLPGRGPDTALAGRIRRLVQHHANAEGGKCKQFALRGVLGTDPPTDAEAGTDCGAE